MEENIGWRIGDGRYVNFWMDKWVPSQGPLFDLIDNPMMEFAITNTVADFILPSGGWDMQKLHSFLSEDLCKKIGGIHIPMQECFSDVDVWNPSHDGCFSLKSAYHSIAFGVHHELHHIFKVVWGWRGP